MSSLRARIEEQLQLYYEFLGFSDLVLKTIDLLMKIEEDRSSLKLFLQKPKLKIKVKQVERETPTP
jgi:hypothetical protein